MSDVGCRMVKSRARARRMWCRMGGVGKAREGRIPLHPTSVGLVLAALVVACVATGAAAQPLRKKCLAIGIDGMRPDAMMAAAAPRLQQLVATGAYSLDAQAEDLTFSGPNWSTILHGIHRDKHNVTTNDYSNSLLAQWPDVFARLEAFNPSLNTARLVTWDAIYIHQPTGADANLFAEYTQNGDAIITETARQIILGIYPQFPRDVDVIFVYYSDVDVAGHTYGFHPSRPGYLAEIANVDGQVGVMLDAIAARPTSAQEDWLVVVTSDHGGAIDGSHAGNTPEKRRIPFIVRGPSAAPGVIFPGPKNVDYVPTILAHMGVPINPAWGLDGRQVGFTPTAPPGAVFGQNLVFNGTGEYDRGFADGLPDQYIAGWDDPGPDMMTVIRYDAGGGYPTPTDPGPAQRGRNFFCGGPSGL